MKVCEVPGLYIMYVSTFELQSQNTTDQVAYKQQTFLSHVSGGQRSNIKVPVCPGEGPLPGDNWNLFSGSSYGGRN